MVRETGTGVCGLSLCGFEVLQCALALTFNDEPNPLQCTMRTVIVRKVCEYTGNRIEKLVRLLFDEAEQVSLADVVFPGEI